MVTENVCEERTAPGFETICFFCFFVQTLIYGKTVGCFCCCSTFSVPLRLSSCDFWLPLTVHLRVNSPFKVADLQVLATVLVFFIAYCDLSVLGLRNKPFILYCDGRKNFLVHLFPHACPPLLSVLYLKVWTRDECIITSPFTAL